jgi:hypothetical protein
MPPPYTLCAPEQSTVISSVAHVPTPSRRTVSPFGLEPLDSFPRHRLALLSLADVPPLHAFSLVRPNFLLRWVMTRSMIVRVRITTVLK